MNSYDTEYTGIKPRFCTVAYYNMMHQGFCVPDSCVNEIEALRFRNGGKYLANPWFPGNTTYNDWNYNDPSIFLTCDVQLDVWCEEPPEVYISDKIQDAYSWTGLVIIFCMFCAMIVHSCLRIILPAFKKYTTAKIIKWLPFSIQTSWREIVNFKRSPKDIKTLHAIRAFSQWWIIVHHTIVIMGYGYRTAAETYQKREWPKYWFYWLFESGMLAVDSFYTIGGFLTGYIMLSKFYKFWKQVETFSGGLKFWLCTREILNNWFFRWLRFTPVMLGITFFLWVMNFLPNSGSMLGSLWWGLREGCTQNQYEKSIWSMFTYVSAWFDIPDGDRCAGWMWYVENDIFYYFYAVVASAYIMHSKKGMRIVGLSMILFGIFFPLILRLTMSLLCHFTPTLFGNYSQWLEYMLQKGDTPAVCDNSMLTDLYYKPYYRCGPYFIGYFVAYLLHYRLNFSWSQFLEPTLRQNGIPRKQIRSILGKITYYITWLLFLVSFAFICFIRKTWYLKPNSWSQTASAIYVGASSSWWALAICGVIIFSEYLYVKSSWNFPQWLLQHKLFLPFSTLNYSTYAVHFAVVIWVVTDLPRFRFFIFKDVFLNAISSVVLSYIVGFCMYVLFEAPFSRIVNSFIKPNLTIDFDKYKSNDISK